MSKCKAIKYLFLLTPPLFLTASVKADIEWGSITSSQGTLINTHTYVSIHNAQFEFKDLNVYGAALVNLPKETSDCSFTVKMLSNFNSENVKVFYRWYTPSADWPQFTFLGGKKAFSSTKDLEFEIKGNCSSRELESSGASVQLAIAISEGSIHKGVFHDDSIYFPMSPTKKCTVSLPASVLNAGKFYIGNGEHQPGNIFTLTNTGTESTQVNFKSSNIDGDNRYILKNSSGEKIALFSLNFPSGNENCTADSYTRCRVIPTGQSANMQINMEKLFAAGTGSTAFTATAFCP